MENPANRIPVIDDDIELCELLTDYLTPEGFDCIGYAFLRDCSVLSIRRHLKGLEKATACAIPIHSFDEVTTIEASALMRKKINTASTLFHLFLLNYRNCAPAQSFRRHRTSWGNLLTISGTRWILYPAFFFPSYFPVSCMSASDLKYTMRLCIQEVNPTWVGSRGSTTNSNETLAKARLAQIFQQKKFLLEIKIPGGTFTVWTCRWTTHLFEYVPKRNLTHLWYQFPYIRLGISASSPLNAP